MSLEFLYEDCRTDDLQILLQYWYKDHSHCDIDYANSACNFEYSLNNSVKSHDSVIVYVDVSPGNKQTYETYKNLCHWKSKNNSSKVYLLPILGAEYYFLLSLYDLQIMTDTDILSVLKCEKSHIDYLKEHCVKNYKKLFSLERFFKYVLREKVYPCIAQGMPRNHYKGVYYNYDCEYPQAYKSILTRTEKSLAYLQQYPVFPGPISEKYIPITDEYLVLIHRYLVDKYNSFADCLRNACSEKQREFVMHIGYAH